MRRHLKPRRCADISSCGASQKASRRCALRRVVRAGNLANGRSAGAKTAETVRTLCLGPALWRLLLHGAPSLSAPLRLACAVLPFALWCVTLRTLPPLAPSAKAAAALEADAAAAAAAAAKSR
eukprot:468616-Prymnesium_polylepis.1